MWHIPLFHPLFSIAVLNQILTSKFTLKVRKRKTLLNPKKYIQIQGPANFRQNYGGIYQRSAPVLTRSLGSRALSPPCGLITNQTKTEAPPGDCKRNQCFWVAELTNLDCTFKITSSEPYHFLFLMHRKRYPMCLTGCKASLCDRRPQ